MSNATATSSQSAAAASGKAVEFSLSAVIEQLPGFAEVEELVSSKFTSEAHYLTTIPAYLFSLGGKRIRPALTLLVGRLFGLTTPTQALLDVAAGIELIHLATLLHDDIIDRSPLRRKKRSPYAEFGIERTLLAGDFLLVRAFSMCARLERPIIDATEIACVDLTEGEILEVPLHQEPCSEQQSLTISRKKTAALFRLACFSGGYTAGCSSETLSALSKFGEELGVAFQILDDILDVTADENLLGKKSGLDLAERKPSLVNVRWLASSSKLAQQLAVAPSTDESAFVLAALNELRDGPIIKSCIATATAHADRARSALKSAVAGAKHSDQHVAAVLEQLIDFTLSRLH